MNIQKYFIKQKSVRNFKLLKMLRKKYIISHLFDINIVFFYILEGNFGCSIIYVFVHQFVCTSVFLSHGCPFITYIIYYIPNAFI